MYATLLRKDHLAGVLLGCAVGDALGAGRRGMHARAALKRCGKPPLQYSYWSGKGVYGEPTRLMLVAAQALLNSRSDRKSFNRAFSRRMRWSLLLLPAGISWNTIRTSLRSHLSWMGVDSGIEDRGGCEATTRAIFFGIALHGAGQRLPQWLQATTELTHRNPVTIEACTFLGLLANTAAQRKYAQESSETPQRRGPIRRPPPAPLRDPAGLLRELAGNCNQPALRKPLDRAIDMLSDGLSAQRAAKVLGWANSIPREIVPVTIMASYAFLRYSGDFRRAVERAILLGGATNWLGAITGALSGSYLGGSEIPAELIKHLGGHPHDPKWMMGMAERYSHWPHGIYDVTLAPAQRSDPMMQLGRNLSILPAAAAHQVKRTWANSCTSLRRR